MLILSLTFNQGRTQDRVSGEGRIGGKYLITVKSQGFNQHRSGIGILHIPHKIVVVKQHNDLGGDQPTASPP